MPSPYMQTSQSIPTSGTTIYIGAPSPARLLPAKAGHLNHDLTHNLTHLAPHRVLSFPFHPVVILRGPIQGSKALTQAKLLLIRTPSPLPSLIPVLRLQRGPIRGSKALTQAKLLLIRTPSPLRSLIPVLRLLKAFH